MKLYTFIYNIFICISCRTPPDDSDESEDNATNYNSINSIKNTAKSDNRYYS